VFYDDIAPLPGNEDRWPLEGEISPSLLTDAPLIVLRGRSDTGVYERTLEAFSKVGVVCPVAVECTDVSIMYLLVERNVGLGLLPLRATNIPRPGLSIYPVSMPSPRERLA
jgi:LysR family transcriptional regulator, salicylic acid-responsive activator of bsdBCD